MSYISQKHISKGRGPAPAIWISEDDYCLSLLFPALLVSCLNSFPRVPIVSSLQCKQFFIWNPGFLLHDLKITRKHWPRCAGSGGFAEVRLRGSCPAVAVCPAPLPSNRHLSSNPCSFPANGKWKVLVKACWSSCQEHVPFWGQEPLLGSGAESWRQGHKFTCQVSSPRPARLPQAQRGREAEHLSTYTGTPLLKETNVISLGPLANFWAPWKSFLNSEIFFPPHNHWVSAKKYGNVDQREKNSASLGDGQRWCSNAE